MVMEGAKMAINRNYFIQNIEATYPDDPYWRPSEIYPEYRYPSRGIAEKNDIYSMIRDMFIELGLDKENVKTDKWNPLGEYINEGQTVLIKPNLVRDTNRALDTKEGFECLITHPSIIRCITDYVIIALNGTGRIIIADAPVQGCDFHKLLDKSGLYRLEEFYKSEGIDIRIEDLRLVHMESENGINITKKNNGTYTGVEVNLGSASYFYRNKHEGRFRITNYDYHDVNAHHVGATQMYCISQACLDADVIINICKPKSHRKAGYTGALKNMIGVNAAKEYLPHHTKGSKEKGYGDEYLTNQFVANARSSLNERIDITNKKEHYSYSRILRFLLKAIEKVWRNMDTEKYSEGSWWGNDTIWRTILDVNRVINYSNKNGTMCDTIQRKIITIGDMILCGEKEGPLLPSPKKVGGILFAENPVVFDLILTRLMGFDRSKLSTVTMATKDKNLFSGKISDIVVNSNQKEYSCKLDEIVKDFAFVASEGWTGVIDKYKGEQ